MHKDIQHTMHTVGTITRGLFLVSGVITLIPVAVFFGILLQIEYVKSGLIFFFFVLFVCVKFIKWIQRNNVQDKNGK